jgi:hypothetical protein
MRWAEGHSYNIRKMFFQLLFGGWSEGGGEAGRGQALISNYSNYSKQIPSTNDQSNVNLRHSGIGASLGQLDQLGIRSIRQSSQGRFWLPSPLSLSEKLEFLYLSPYYLQAAFFLLGTISWLFSETIFQARLPFWTNVWGWSLVLTNLLSLPLMNTVGLFLEEAEEKDFSGTLSFILLSYLLVPFQAYASIKGFLETQEGPWFRTPKTGKITDILTRGRFYRLIAGILPGRKPAVAQAMAGRPADVMASSGRFQIFPKPTFDFARVKNWAGRSRVLSRGRRFVGRSILASFIILSIFLNYLSFFSPITYAQVEDPSIEQQINIMDQVYASSGTTNAPTDNSMGVVRWDGTKYTSPTVYFDAAMKGFLSTGNQVGQYSSIYCVAADDCKIAYYDISDTSLRFVDCGNEDCTSYSIRVLDGGTGCALSGCSTGDDAGLNTSIYCPSSTNCKIVYNNNTDTSLLFADCNDSACGSGSVVILDGNTGCTLDNCSTTSIAGGYQTSIACPTSTNCKIAYLDSTSTALRFVDCGTEDCSTSSAGDGSTVILDGASGCTLDGCATVDDEGYFASIACPTSTNCKISYYDNSDGALRFVDCGTEDCSTSSAGDGSRVLLDGFTGCTLDGCSGSADVGRRTSIVCPTSTNCKIAHVDNTNSALKFADCGTEDCSTASAGDGSSVILDGNTGCTLDNCVTSLAVGDTGTSIACPTATNCKISYFESTNTAMKFADCGVEACSTASAGDGSAVILDGFTGCTLDNCSTSTDVGQYNTSIACPSSTNCKISNFDNTNITLRFADCATEDCSTSSGGDGATLKVDGSIRNVGQYNSIYCVAADDCKVVYYDASDTSLRFIDCDDVVCSGFTMQILDGASDCTLTNCSTSADVGQYTSITCPSSTNCKITYYDVTNSALKFADCDASTCNVGSAVILDGNTGCTLDNCSTSATTGQWTSITCPTTTNCKISYYDNGGGNLMFADCGTEDCSTSSAGDGSAVILDGASGCTLDGCHTTDDDGQGTSIACPTSTNCKIAYFEATDSNLWFADCGTEDCSTSSAGDGSRTLLDGAGGCTLSGCSTTQFTGQYPSISCPASDNCKIAYHSNGSLILEFADCGTETCSSGTNAQLDGISGCTLDNCSTSDDVGYFPSIACPAANNCKISYRDGTNNALLFADCGTEDCSTASAGDGSRVILDGASGCTLDNCDTSADGQYTSISCPSSADCKISYFNPTSTFQDLSFADCGTEDCSTSSPGDGRTWEVDDGRDYGWARLFTTGSVAVADGVVMGRPANASNGAYFGYWWVGSPAVSLSNGTEYSVRFNNSLAADGGRYTYTKAARLIIAQAVGAGSSIANTQTQVEVGNSQNDFSNTSYSTLTDHKIYLFDINKFSGTKTVYFEATLHTDTAGNTVSAQLLQCTSVSNCSSGSAVSGSEVTHTGNTNWTRKRTASGITLTDDANFAVQVKMSGGTGDIANAKIIIEQSSDNMGLTDIELVHEYVNTKNSLAQTGTTAYARLSVAEGAAVSGSTVSTTNTSYTRVRSSSITTSTNAYDTEISLDNSTFTEQGYVNPYTSGNWVGGTFTYLFEATLRTPSSNNEDISNSWLIIQVSSLAVPENLIYFLPFIVFLPRIFGKRGFNFGFLINPIRTVDAQVDKYKRRNRIVIAQVKA